MFGIYLFIFSALLQADAKPLPELKTLLADFQRNLHTDDVLLSQYTYTEKRTHIELKSDGEPQKKETDVYQITRGSDGAIYRKLISNNDKPVKAAKPEKVSNISRRDDEKVIADIFAGYDMQIVDREDFHGRPAIRVHFAPRPHYHPTTRQGRLAQHVAGDAWIDEADRQLARVEAEVIDYGVPRLRSAGETSEGRDAAWRKSQSKRGGLVAFENRSLVYGPDSFAEGN